MYSDATGSSVALHTVNCGRSLRMTSGCRNFVLESGRFRTDRWKQANAKTGKTAEMAIHFAAPRHARVRARAAGAFAWSPAPRAHDAPGSAAPTRRDRRQARKPATGGRANAPAAPAAAEQHRLPPDSTTKQTLALPGRTLAFTATAGSIRLFDDKGEPQADIAYTAYQLDGADARPGR